MQCGFEMAGGLFPKSTPQVYSPLPTFSDYVVIQGESWGLEIGLSRTAEAHLENALDFFRDRVLAAG